MKTIVLVEDRETTRAMVEETLRRRGFEVSGAGSVEEGKDLLAEKKPDLLLTDLQLPDGSGIDLLAHGTEADARLPVIVMSAFGTIEIAVEAIKRGAYDFVTKPFDTNRLVSLVENALERRPRAADVDADADGDPEEAGIVGVSARTRETIRAARKVAPSDATVLVLGESGTGKELVARSIHGWSGRSSGPMVSVNCAAIPRDLAEAELFGSEKGSFTGAVARKLGKVELASGGTLFLDEVGELSLDLQPKLLRILQERTYMRVGGTEELHTDIRVVAATNQDLADRVRDGQFREDLFYRLNVFPIVVAPLRDRPEDVVPLAEKFLRFAAEKLERPALTLSKEARDLLSRCTWPGNVRQLQNAIERAVILTEGPEIQLGDFQDLETGSRSAGAAGAPQGATLLEVGRHAQRAAETEAIVSALRTTGGNKKEAAKRLGVSYKTLWSKLKEYEIS